MELKTVTTSGKETMTSINDAVFTVTADPKIVAQSVRVYLSNQRQGTAKTKTRGEVDLTTKKWYRQKHTGRARHGAQSAPIFVGGGVTHGPNGNSNWKLSLSKPMRIRALQTAIGMQIKDGNVMVMTGLEKIGTKTKEFVSILKASKLEGQKVLIIADTTLPNLIQSSRNVASILCSRVDRLNTYEVMAAHKVLVTPEALSQLEAKFAGTTKETKPEEKKHVVKKAVTKKAPATKTATKSAKKTTAK